MTILRARSLRRRSVRGALGEVIFNLNPRVRAPQFDGVVTEWRDCRHVALLWDLFFNLNDDGRQLALDLHYRTALYDATTIRRWIAAYERMLEDIGMRDWPVLAAARVELGRLVAREVGVFALYTGGAAAYFTHRAQFAATFGAPTAAACVRFEYWPDCDHMFMRVQDRARLLQAIGDWGRALA